MLWKARKRLWCGLPWTFTVYSLDEERLYVDKGFFTQRQDEVRLYRVMDIAMTRTLMQRIFGIGTVHLVTSDKMLGSFDLVNIKKTREVKELLSELVEEQRDRKKVSTREFIDTDEDGHDDDLCSHGVENE